MHDDDVKQKIIDRIEPEQVYGELRQKGRYLARCCPLHEEKTPSFIVNADKSWHCFGGCTDPKGGDYFTFVMAKEGVSFPEALKMLADKAGVNLQPTNGGGYAKLYDVNKAAAAFYSANLWSNPEALKYFTETRGFTEESIKRFHLGYTNGESLVDHLKSVGFTAQEIIAAGLARERDGQLKDFFFRRFMFPIVQRGRIPGFIGRCDDPLYKYVNSPETAIFKKSELVYGRDTVAIKAMGYAIVVEGNPDVVMCHQHGFKNTGAPLGTAFGKSHVTLLKKHTDTIYLVFDGDKAGSNAAQSAAKLMFDERMKGGVAKLPEGEDPDSFLRKGGDLNLYLDLALPFSVFLARTFPKTRKMVLNTLLTRGAMEVAEFLSYMTTPEEMKACEEFSARGLLHRVLARSPLVVRKDGIEVKKHGKIVVLFYNGWFIRAKEVESEGDIPAVAEGMLLQMLNVRDQKRRFDKAKAAISGEAALKKMGLLANKTGRCAVTV